MLIIEARLYGAAGFVARDELSAFHIDKTSASEDVFGIMNDDGVLVITPSLVVRAIWRLYRTGRSDLLGIVGLSPDDFQKFDAYPDELKYSQIKAMMAGIPRLRELIRVLSRLEVKDGRLSQENSE